MYVLSGLGRDMLLCSWSALAIYNQLVKTVILWVFVLSVLTCSILLSKGNNMFSVMKNCISDALDTCVTSPQIIEHFHELWNLLCWTFHTTVCIDRGTYHVVFV